MHFTTDINLGNLVTVVAFIFTLYQFHQSNVKRLHRIEFKVALMWKHFAHKFDLPEELADSEKDE
jgi:hypothetical protein